MAEEVKVIIGADTKQLTSELNKANESIKKFGSSVQTGANKASLALTDLSRIAQDAPYGFIGISNNINPLVESFGRLKAETGSTGSALKALVGSLSGPAGLGLAFGLFSAAISFASVGLSRWVKTSEEAKAKTDEVKKGLESIYGSVAKEATEVTSLVAILKNENETRFRKLDAIKELQKISPEIFSNLKLEKDAVIGLDSSYTNYIESLKTVVAAKIVQAKLDKELVKLIELEGTTQTSIDKKNAQSSTFFLKQRINDLKKFGAEGQNQARLLQQEVDRIEGDLSGSTKLKIENTNKQIEELRNKLIELSTGLKLSGNSANEASKKISESIDQILSKFRRKLTAEESLGLPPIEEIKAKINDFEAVIKKLITEKKVSPTDSIILNLKAELGELQDDLLYQQIGKKMLENRQPIKLINPFVFEYTAEQQAIIDRYQQKLANESKKAALKTAMIGGMGLVIPVKPKIDFSSISGAVDKEAYALNEKINKALQEELQSGAYEAGVLFAESLANGLASGDISSFFEGINGIIADGMIRIGKQFIKFAAELITIQKTLISNPTTALIAGIALVAIGTAMKNQMAKQKAFAVGTSFAPGGMALVGERGPELVSLPQGSKVIPNGKTNSMMQGALQAVEVYGTLRGQDIYFSNKKYGLTYNRQT